jgi:hypothetical protein
MKCMNFRMSVLLLFLIGALAACGQAEPTPQPPAPPTPEPVTEAESTPAAMPTPTTALPTPIVMPATVTPVPTITVAPTPEAAETGGDSLTFITLADFGTDRNPLTGEQVDPANLERRPIAFKLSNAPPQFVRPQSGLNEADLVFEHITEGSITRLTLIVYGNNPRDIGPIRSARLIDVELPAMYDSALVFSGASTGVNQRLNRSDFVDRILRGGAGYYRTGANKPYEHTLYGNPLLFWQQMDQQGLNTPPNFTSNMAFGSQPPPGGSPATAVSIDYRWEVVRWEYDAGQGRYRRWAANEPHRDGNTNEQVAVANVAVVFANHVEDPTICEEIRDGRCLHLSLQIQVWGSGRAIIFRDGQQYNVTWQRTNRSDMLSFYDEAGNPFPLQIGNTWFQMAPLGWDNQISVTR